MRRRRFPVNTSVRDEMEIERAGGREAGSNPVAR